MSQVDVLMPGETLPPRELPKSPDRTTSYVGTNGETSSGSARSDKGKQILEINDVDVDGDRKRKVTFNGDSNETQPQIRKKRHRRGKKRRWRPYSQLTWEEKKEQQEREAKRAEKVRADMCACGITLAPYNTTQFLMDDHNLREPDYEHIPVNHHRHRENSHSNDSSDEFYSSPEDEEDFLQQQFTETYKSIHAERLSNMSKGELVQELMSFEDKVEVLQKRLDEIAAMETTRDPDTVHEDHNVEEQLEKIRVFKEEILNLTEENERLRRENEELRSRSSRSLAS